MYFTVSREQSILKYYTLRACVMRFTRRSPPRGRAVSHGRYRDVPKHGNTFENGRRSTQNRDVP